MRYSTKPKIMCTIFGFVVQVNNEEKGKFETYEEAEQFVRELESSTD